VLFARPVSLVVGRAGVLFERLHLINKDHIEFGF
jgi:hypothetical protein